MLKIGIVGYSAKSFPIYKASNLILNSVFEVLNDNKSAEIVSWYTDYGIPALTYTLVDMIMDSKYNNLSLLKVGYAPKVALSDKLCKVDKEIIVGDDYGDESTSFVNYVDALIRVGGGAQSLKEVQLFKDSKPDSTLIECDLICYN